MIVKKNLSDNNLKKF